MEKMTPKHFHLELYGMHYYYFIGWSRDSFIAYIEKIYPEFDIDAPASYEYGSTDFIEDKSHILIWVSKSSNMHATLCHEAVHAACFTLDWCGVYADLKEDEAIAYLAELLVLKGADEIQGLN